LEEEDESHKWHDNSVELPYQLCLLNGIDGLVFDIAGDELYLAGFRRAGVKLLRNSARHGDS
jgi:hypothetical protein